MSTRREFLALAAVGVSASAALTSCMSRSQFDSPAKTYQSLSAALRAPLGVGPSIMDCLRYASLASNGHNTQPWRFATTDSDLDIYPDFTRRTPAVDPDDHHLFVSLGCAAENFALAAAACGRPADSLYLPEADGRVHFALNRSDPVNSPLVDAIPLRQSTRSLYSGATVSSHGLRLLETAAKIEGVNLSLFTGRLKIKAISDFVLAANQLQMADPRFMTELKKWLRFNAGAAVLTSDGLYSAASGSPSLPTWVGNAIFPFVFTASSEDKKYADQMESSAGVAVFTGDIADKAHWVKVGRSVQRFALQVTALGMRYAVVNQPIEVASIRSEFARWMGIPGRRPDFIVRFGYANPMPMSLRRPVSDCLVHS